MHFLKYFIPFTHLNIIVEANNIKREFRNDFDLGEKHLEFPPLEK